MTLPFEFFVLGRPVSQQTRRRELVREWRAQVRGEAERSWNSEDAPHGGALMVTLTYFYDEMPMDVDNIPKPVLDALVGLVYDDDSQVTDILCRKRELRPDLSIPKRSPVLRLALGHWSEFLHVVIEEARDMEVTY